MADFQSWDALSAKLQAHLTVDSVQVSSYAILRCIYFSYLHPLSHFPGPRIAAVSNTWYAYHWFSGRWPWVMEDVLREYGDVVRIAPNELVFFTPKAFHDIYAPQHKGLETWVKTNFQNRGKDLGGIVWEEDPIRHREVARKLSPAFSSQNSRAMDPVVEKHVTHFIERMKELGSVTEGVSLIDWSNWYYMDLSADLVWNEETHQMRDRKSSVYLDVLLGFNAFATVMQVFKRFPLIKPMQYLFVPLSKLSSLGQVKKMTKQAVERRIERRGKLHHGDYFEFILPDPEPLPSNRREQYLIGSLGLQLLFTSFGPMSDWLYGIIVFLTEEPECYKEFVAEIRGHFNSLDEITPEALTSLPYLHAALEESLRLLPSNSTGLPRFSPGGTVDGHYIPKGTHVQTSVFANGRSPRFFHEPLKFRPQRWLPSSHPLYDKAFEDDNLKGLYPFNLGPRVCLGRQTAWRQGKLSIAKVLWFFDIVRVPGQDFDLERDLLHYGFLEKPDLKVRFLPVQR
ncbi:unnamed protein product [Clonostachys rhizophaga]|uniref:Cytochrome P450 n=1 Tax=Clonostachys rhizophaga TaxID=160324 RepID=A0A9N9W2H3_9HYPO|nr:unnamed protein product [Clonostachys rhizophaga]